MTNNITYALEISFKEECHVINLPMEYPNFTGVEEWAIFTSLTDAELRTKYESIIRKYEPFVYMTKDQYDPIRKSRNNDRSHRRRCSTDIVPFSYEDDLSEKCNDMILLIDPFEGKPNWTKLYLALEQLAPKRRIRIEKYYFDGMSFAEIAREENVSTQAVQQSVERSLAKLAKYLKAENFDPYDDPIWG